MIVEPDPCPASGMPRPLPPSDLPWVRPVRQPQRRRTDRGGHVFNISPAETVTPIRAVSAGEPSPAAEPTHREGVAGPVLAAASSAAGSVYDWAREVGP